MRAGKGPRRGNRSDRPAVQEMERDKDELSRHEWWDAIEERLFSKSAHPLDAAREALRHFPDDAPVLELAAFAALVEDQPEPALRYLKKLARLFYPQPALYIARAIALAQSGKWPPARSLLESTAIPEKRLWHFCPSGLDRKWFEKWVHDILRWQPQPEPVRRRHDAKPLPKPTGTPMPASAPAAAIPATVAPLPRYSPRIPIRLTLPDAAAYDVLDRAEGGSAEDFLLRHDLAHAALFRTFDELLCLPHLRGVDHYWYQIETARKVLKQFRGRVLLADEVGLGKTIEAGMVLKEYMMRGMADRVLILTPASLVGQWREEMETKFGIEFIDSRDPLLHRDPQAFWSHARIIASIATARREVHWRRLAQRPFDLVIVDEAHHLKNRSSKNWKLVDGLQKRFLLLLSATPIQNSLIELYNLLTLLKPGIFKTEREFRTLYATPGNPRVPANRERLRELMRDVMVRNTRALVDVRLPPRRAATVLAEPSEEELGCYQDLCRLVRGLSQEEMVRHSMALHRLLEAAGSSPRAARASLERFVEPQSPAEWREILARYGRLPGSAKWDALRALLERNPEEKKIVFVRFRETLHMLEDLLSERAVPFSRFEGSMSSAEKDAAIERFRLEVPVLLSTESGGEGRNLQFCNTLINFDLPWNPQLIEQRIGRIHRIGQTREVFVFNLAAKHTVEEHILRILDEKIHMFELVVGEIQSILGELGDEQDFAELVFKAWVAQTEEDRRKALERIGEQLMAARQEYEAAKALDDEIFGEEFEVA